jgi:thiamine kinase-like enzyme
MPIIGKMIDEQLEGSMRASLEMLSRLPRWLVNSRDPELVTSALVGSVPEFISGQYRLLHCDVGNVRYKSKVWKGTYALDVERAADGSVQQVELQGKVFPPTDVSQPEMVVEGEFGTEGWHAYFPDLHLDLRPMEKETVLDSLEWLIQPETARQYLQNQIGTRSPAYQNFRLQSVTPKIVRYKPGSRCTILYSLEYPPNITRGERWPDLVVGKTYRNEKGQNAYDSMEAVWNSPVGCGVVVTVAEPLAYEADKRILIQGPVPEEQIFKDLMKEAIHTGNDETIQKLRKYLKKTAVGLALIHRSGIAYGKEWRWENELNAVREPIEKLNEAIPGLSSTVDPLLDRLSALSAIIPPDPLAPSHGSFRPAQVLINGEDIGFIDFDSFCQAEPALDIGLFLAAFLNTAVTYDLETDDSPKKLSTHKNTWRKRYDQFLLCADEFIDEYLKENPVSRERVALYTALDILMLVLHCWSKNKGAELDCTMYLLERYMQTSEIMSIHHDA